VSDVDLAVGKDAQVRGSVGLQEDGSCFDVVNKAKSDTRPAGECAGVAPAGEECAQGKFERRTCDHSSSQMQTCV
jgi:hypothetical protein